MNAQEPWNPEWTSDQMLAWLRDDATRRETQRLDALTATMCAVMTARTPKELLK